jgi:LAS superfamily LD-carboxypeptidase LdcB
MTKKQTFMGLIMLIILSVIICVILLNSKHAGESDSSASASVTETEEATASATATVDPETDSRFFDTDSLLIIANKTHKLPDGYEPSDLRAVTCNAAYDGIQMRDEAATALEKMFAAALEDGVTLRAQSGYRSQSYQEQLYNSYAEKDGTEEADTYSSRAGYSDHQTGLAMDIADHDGATVFSAAMKDTPEGEWLYQHAHEYGFVERYPEGKESITGYTFEPWHYRYVGVDTATAVYSVSPDETLEEYFGISGGDYAE